jgi:hypothetical protein
MVDELHPIEDVDAAATEAEAIVEQVRPLLAGHDPGVQGAALADLLATWLAGFQMPDGPPKKLQAFRRNMLKMHIEQVWQLVPINEQERDEKLAHSASGPAGH